MATHSDILMVLFKGSTPVVGETQATLSGATKKDPLLAGPPKFEETKCFELDSFSLSLACPPDDSSEKKTQTTNTLSVAGPKIAVSSSSRRPTGTTWLAPNLNEISCSRKMDSASTVLFGHCADKTIFDTAAIIRRKVTGGGLQHGHEVGHLMTFLRIDFTMVQLLAVSWGSDDDDIKEQLSFVCKSAAVQYRQQMHTGTVTERPLPPGKWQG